MGATPERFGAVPCGACPHFAQQSMPGLHLVSLPRIGLSKTIFFTAKNRVNAFHMSSSLFFVTKSFQFNKSVKITHADIDLAAAQRACKRDLISPVPLESHYFQAVEWLCAQIVTGRKPVKGVKSPEADLNSKRRGS